MSASVRSGRFLSRCRVITLNHSNLRPVMTRLMIIIFLPRSWPRIWRRRFRPRLQLSWNLVVLRRFSISKNSPIRTPSHSVRLLDHWSILAGNFIFRKMMRKFSWQFNKYRRLRGDTESKSRFFVESTIFDLSSIIIRHYFKFRYKFWSIVCHASYDHTGFRKIPWKKAIFQSATIKN